MGASGAKYMLLWDDFAGEALKGPASLGVTTFVALKPGATDTPPGTRNFIELLAGDPKFDGEATQGDDTAVILYTSRPNRKPKGPELTHPNLLIKPHNVTHLLGNRPPRFTP